MWANGTILKDPDSGLWRMYHNASSRLGCLAVSEDLIHWTRPNLGIFEHNGSTDNNIVFKGSGWRIDTISIIYDQRDPDPKRRWKASIYFYDSKPKRF